MKVKVYRDGEYIMQATAEQIKKDEFAYIEGVLTGDVLETEDGAKLKVLWNNDNPGYLRDGLSFQLME